MSLTNITTKQEFEKHVLKNDKLVLVDFWADWCPPCKMMAPILHDISESMKEEVDIVKVDVEASQDNGLLAAEHQVQSIPNMTIYKNGQIVETLIGARPAQILKDDLKNLLKF